LLCFLQALSTPQARLIGGWPKKAWSQQTTPASCGIRLSIVEAAFFDYTQLLWNQVDK
jgi:hypothetical protein